MLNRLKEEQSLRMDKRLTTVVQIIVEQYDGDVMAFVESIRTRAAVERKTGPPTTQHPLSGGIHSFLTGRKRANDGP